MVQNTAVLTFVHHEHILLVFLDSFVNPAAKHGSFFNCNCGILRYMKHDAASEDTKMGTS